MSVEGLWGVSECNLNFSFTEQNLCKSDATKSTMRGGWGITFRDRFAIPRHVTRYYNELGTAVAWFTTQVRVRDISDVLPSVT